MLRLATKIATTPVRHINYIKNPSVQIERQVIECLQREVKTSTVFVIDNISEYVDLIRPETIDIGEYFSATIPMVSTMFVEWSETIPAEYSGSVGVTTQMGCMVSSYPTEQSEAKYRICLRFFVCTRGQLTSIVGAYFVDVDDSGKIIGLHFNAGLDMFQELVGPMTCKVLYAINFANCKNVAKRDATDELGPSPKWVKRQKAPTIRYHVLEIDPSKTRSASPVNPEADGPKKSLHICRGHFVTYTAEKPLFGKYVGTFWVPAHVRGSKEYGVVEKDYSIKGPKQMEVAGA